VTRPPISACKYAKKPRSWVPKPRSWAPATEIASEYYQQGREQVLALEQTIEAQIRDKPIQSLLIAGGVGLLIGFLCRRR
jgi:ElaB/YqjD/DUF883 family membrane-anchored ribosome-binding protein